MAFFNSILFSNNLLFSFLFTFTCASFLLHLTSVFSPPIPASNSCHSYRFYFPDIYISYVIFSSLLKQSVSSIPHYDLLLYSPLILFLIFLCLHKSELIINIFYRFPVSSIFKSSSLFFITNSLFHGDSHHMLSSLTR